MTACFLPSPAFAGWPFRVAYRFPLTGTRRGATVRSSDVINSSGENFDLLQNLTRSTLPGRPATARRPDGRVASASRSALAGCSSLPVPFDSSSSPAADELLQRPLDEGTVLHRPPERLGAASRRALHPAFSPPWMIGDFFYLGFPELWRFQRAFACLETECGALVRATLTQFDPTRRGVRQGPGLGLGQKGGHHARRFNPPVARDSWVTIPPSTGRWLRPRILATTRSAQGLVRNSQSLEPLV